jgi:hypothetical protein
VCRADSFTTFYVPIVLKSENLSLLEPSGPIQACIGIALPFFTCAELMPKNEWKASVMPLNE